MPMVALRLVPNQLDVLTICTFSRVQLVFLSRNVLLAIVFKFIEVNCSERTLPGSYTEHEELEEMLAD